MDEYSRVTAHYKIIKHFILYVLIVSLLSAVLKSILNKGISLLLISVELFLFLSASFVLLFSTFRLKKGYSIAHEHIYLKNTVKYVSIPALALYVLVQFLLLKYPAHIFNIDPILYINVLVIMLLVGVLTLIVYYGVSLHHPTLFTARKKYIKFVIKVNSILFLLFSSALIFALLLNFVFNRFGHANNLISTLIILYFNVALHYSMYSIYEWRHQLDEANIIKKETGIVTKTLIVLVAIYSTFAVIKELNTLIYTVQSPNALPIINMIHNLDHFIFFYATTLITLVIFSVQKSLNSAYPRTIKLVNAAVIIWLVKIFVNVLVRVNDSLLFVLTDYSNAHGILTQTFTIISLCFNLTLLLCGLAIIFLNRFPALKLWGGLALVQIINFGFNFSMSLFRDVTKELLISNIKLFTNFGLLIFKLFFVFLIIVVYQKPRVITNEQTIK